MQAGSMHGASNSPSRCHSRLNAAPCPAQPQSHPQHTTIVSDSTSVAHQDRCERRPASTSNESNKFVKYFTNREVDDKGKTGADLPAAAQNSPIITREAHCKCGPSKILVFFQGSSEWLGRQAITRQG